MKKLLAILSIFAMATLMLPVSVLAAGGIYASGGGNITVGQTFTVNVTASGATFDTVHGAISISGPVSVVSFSAGDATWISKPSNGGTFDGAFLGNKKTSFTVATIKLKATGVGSGSVSISGVALKNAGATVGTGSGNASFTIQKAPDLPGKVSVSSSSHPDPNTAYEATTISLSWNKDSGVDGFSYLLDQTADTTPPAKITDANTSATYADKAVGTYYFHIKGHKPDGWGSTTHFKINIKEPDAKIDETLAKPSDIQINKSDNFVNNIKDGTVTGIIISGIVTPGFTVNLTLTPAPTIPEGKTLSTISDDLGNWSLVLDYPIVSGFHKLTVQGQKDKVLTPISDEITFEISQKDGGIINMITSNDEFAPVKAAETPQKESFKFSRNMVIYGSLGIVLLILIIVLIIQLKKHSKAKGLIKAIKN